MATDDFDDDIEDEEEPTGPFDDLNAAANALEKNPNDAPDLVLETVGDVVNTLYDAGHLEHINNRHDEVLGIKDELQQEFLDTPLYEATGEDFEEKFASQIKIVLDQANIVIPLLNEVPEEGEED